MRRRTSVSSVVGNGLSVEVFMGNRDVEITSEVVMACARLLRASGLLWSESSAVEVVVRQMLEVALAENNPPQCKQRTIPHLDKDH